MLARRSVAHPVASGTIQGKHAADRRDAPGRRIGAKQPPVCRELPIQLAVYDARLNANTILVHADDSSHGVGEIQDEARTERFAGQARSGSARVERDLVLGRVLHARHDIRYAARPDHAQRLDLVDARVAGVHLEKDVVAAHFAVQTPSQIGLDPLSFLIHGATALVIPP